MAHYMDTSALVKLVVSEPESEALRTWIRETEPLLVSSDLTRTELLRVTRRASPENVLAARCVLSALHLMTLSTSTFEAAGQLDPTILRTPDAVHLAAALELGDDLSGVVTYDERLAESARHHGIPVLAPA